MQELFDTQILTRLAEEIERHRQHVKTIPDRHARLFALKEAIKLIAKLQKIIHATSLSAAPAFRDSLSRLGEHLSSQAIEELAGSVAWMIDERAIVHAFERRGRGDVHFMDRLTRVTRQVVSVKIGPKLLTGLLDRLKAPLEVALRLERGNRGGRPGLVYRNYVVEELVRDYRTRTGAWPSAAKSGPFIEACQDVLVQLNIETEGLEAALERIIKKLKT